MLYKVGEPKKSVMCKVLYVPQLSCNLFSVRSAASKGNFIRFGQSQCWIRDGKEMATGIDLPKQTKLTFCEGCVAGKMERALFKPVGEIQSKRKLQIVHSDVCGPMPTDSTGGNKYFVTFIDDYSKCCAVYFLKSKSEVPEKFKEFEACVFRDCGLHVGILCSDNGGEYLSRSSGAI